MQSDDVCAVLQGRYKDRGSHAIPNQAIMIGYVLLITSVLCNNREDNSLVNFVPVFFAGGILLAIGAMVIWGYTTDKNKNAVQ
jgi:hypothetical protein